MTTQTDSLDDLCLNDVSSEDDTCESIKETMNRILNQAKTISEENEESMKIISDVVNEKECDEMNITEQNTEPNTEPNTTDSNVTP